MIGLLCPGQGAQFVGMGQDLARAYPIARDTFAEADEALGIHLSHLCWEGPESELTLTKNAQPAILAHTVATWRAIEKESPVAIRCGAGHSLGEFSAYVAAGALSFVDALRTVRRRGELMFEAGRVRPGTMTAILGLDDAAAEAICREASSETEGVVVAANYNSPGQLVISGDIEAVARAEELAREAGARRVVPLNVSGAFHSPLMEVAIPGLRDALDGVALNAPAFPIVSNVTAQPVTDPERARQLLVEQLTSPVRWVASIAAMRDAGVEEFLEVGPGSVLTGLLRRIDRTARGRAVGTADELRTFLGEEE